MLAGRCALAVVVRGVAARQRWVIRNTIIVISNVNLHLLLDSVASMVRWCYPPIRYRSGVFPCAVPVGWWAWNYILHWTFGLEVIIVVAAISLLYYKNTSEAEHRICRGTLPSCGQPF
jgi:hypothetical protein